MKLMTEREAWLWMAKAWARAGAKGILLGERVNGICCCIRAMHDDMIDDKTYSVMRRKMNADYRASRWPNFWWPTTKNGNQRRAAFCRRMAKECK